MGGGGVVVDGRGERLIYCTVLCWLNILWLHGCSEGFRVVGGFGGSFVGDLTYVFVQHSLRYFEINGYPRGTVQEFDPRSGFPSKNQLRGMSLGLDGKWGLY
eukprot:GFKZ01008840.1.p1 GENE.GFKZ01008840.1~~GFKZ01008840.1.p1  ORF type:complete len:102 (-),score=1.77 GFKZ01008840.1:440-745(-)